MKLVDASQLVIGHWATICCHLDLVQIESQDDIDYFSSFIDDEISAEIWQTRKEALIEIRSHFNPDIGLNDEAIAEIDRLLDMEK